MIFLTIFILPTHFIHTFKHSKMKELSLLCCLFVGIYSYSQVGIGTTDPKATLDIIATNNILPANNDGLLIPRINAFPLANPTVDQNGMLVFLNTDTDPASPFGVNSAGFYYWNFTLLKWIGFSTIPYSWQLTGNTATVSTNFMGTTDDTPLNFKINGQKSGTINKDHTFWGYQSGNSNNDFGTDNVGIGQYSLFTNTSGGHNTALGTGSLQLNLIGNDNTASGYRALYQNTNGSANTAFGNEALFSNTTAQANTAVGYQALHSTIEHGENVAVGFQALYNTTSDSNTGIGYFALYSNTTGDSNTAIGRDVLRSNTANSNTAVGRGAMRDNTSGENNTASGRNAMRNNITGNDNTAMGHYSMESNQTGSGNTAMGINSMTRNTLGESNIALGKEALFSNISGNDNTVVGFSALYINTTGVENTAIGHEASRNSTGDFNTSLGTDALRDNTTGSHNTALGHGANVSTGNLTNATALGSNAIVNASNKVRIGDSNVTAIEGEVAMTVTSDKRAKDQIHTIPLGLNFINLLHPVEYIKKSNTEKTKEWGLIAQELQETLMKLGYKNAGIVGDDNSKDHFLSIRYTDLIAPMINAIQELSRSKQEVAILKTKLADQNAKIEALMERVLKLEQKN